MHLEEREKEKVHSFTQIFAAYLKNFSDADKPLDKVLIEYYTSALGPDLAMFAKGRAKPTLTETYEEEEVVEAERESIEYYPDSHERKVREGNPYCLLSLRKRNCQIFKIWQK